MLVFVFVQSLLSYMCLTKWLIEGESISLSHDGLRWRATFSWNHCPSLTFGSRGPERCAVRSIATSDWWTVMLHAMTYDHLSSEQSEVRWQQREWLNGLHSDEKKKIFYPGKCVKQSSSFITSQLKHLSVTRKHEMCYWSEFPSEEKTPGQLKRIHSRTVQVRQTLLTQRVQELQHESSVWIWGFLSTSQFLVTGFTTDEPRQIQHLVAQNHKKRNEMDHFQLERWSLSPDMVVLAEEVYLTCSWSS